MSRLNKIISIKLAWQPESLAGLSDCGSNLPCLTTWVQWVGVVLLSPAHYADILSLLKKQISHALYLLRSPLSLSLIIYVVSQYIEWWGQGLGEFIHEFYQIGLANWMPKNDMKILVKMISLKGICLVKVESQVVWDPEIDIIKRRPHFLFSRPCIKRKVAWSRFVASDQD